MTEDPDPAKREVTRLEIVLFVLIAVGLAITGIACIAVDKLVGGNKKTQLGRHKMPIATTPQNLN